MIGILYFFVILIANTVGAISGMGGGVLIKPIFDLIGAHPLAAISFYSSVAVLTMSVVSTLLQVKNKVDINWPIALLVSLGSMIGGSLGNSAFEMLLASSSEAITQTVQIILTILTLGFALIYSWKKGYSWKLKSKVLFFVVGMLLGFLASLLGIGGGPINVALLMLCFGIPIKEATVYSIITIFFSQLSKVVTIGVTSGFGRFDLSMLLYVIPAAIIGGWLGARVSGVISSEKVNTVYQVVIVIVLLINTYNGIMLFV